jgi:hypothetical protein
MTGTPAAGSVRVAESDPRLQLGEAGLLAVEGDDLPVRDHAVGRLDI